jgi:hypothetical protein
VASSPPVATAASSAATSICSGAPPALVVSTSAWAPPLGFRYLRPQHLSRRRQVR